MESNLNNLVDADVLAKFFGREVRTIQYWSQVEGMPKEDRGLYDFVKCVHWRITKLEEKLEEAEKGDITLYKLKQENQRLINREKEITIKKLEGDLIDTEQANQVTVSTIKMLMTNLESIPTRLNKKLNGDSKTLAIIRDEISEFRNICANTPMDWYEKELSNLDNEDTRDNSNENAE